MNIDLLITPEGETGLLCSRNLTTKATCVLFDPHEQVLSIEMKDLDSLVLNIPLDDSFIPALDQSPLIHIGAVVEGKISQAYQVPILFLGDDERNRYYARMRPSNKPLVAFSYFIKKCVLGQPVHREDAGDEETIGCILGDAVPAALTFAPHLERRASLEAAPSAQPQLNVPGLGLGGSSSGSGTTYYSGRTSDGNNSEES